MPEDLNHQHHRWQNLKSLAKSRGLSHINAKHRNAWRGHSVKIDNSSIERVEEFKYLGTMLTDQNSIQEEIKSRLKLRNACYHSVQNLLSSRLLSKNLKWRYYEVKLTVFSRTGNTLKLLQLAVPIPWCQQYGNIVCVCNCDLLMRKVFSVCSDKQLFAYHVH
jgi:hypothetical protein